jgi:ZIP family zinc transporter
MLRGASSRCAAQVAFASFTDFGPLMAMAVALHNIPEGLIVAGAPLIAAFCMRRRC